MNKAYLYLYRRDAGSSIRRGPQPNGQAGRVEAGHVEAGRRVGGTRGGGTPGRLNGQAGRRVGQAGHVEAGRRVGA